MPAWSAGVQSGLRSAQPTPASDAAGVLYFVEDEGVLERWSGSAWVLVANASGAMLAYGEANPASDPNITATSAATATLVMAASAFIADGTSPVYIDAFIPSVDGPPGQSLLFVLYLDGVQVGTSWGQVSIDAGVNRWPVHLSTRQVPAAGSRVYDLRAWVVSGTGVIRNGVNYLPSLITVRAG